MRLSTSTVSIVAAAVVSTLALSAHAAQLVSFDPAPITAALPEVVYNLDAGHALKTAPGFAGSGATPPGTGGVHFQSAIPVSGGATNFNDVTLALTGLNSTTPAMSYSAGPNSILLLQSLNGGTFSFISSAADGKTDLLSGTIGEASISGFKGSGTGSVLSTTITYTSGLVYDALVAIGAPTVGELSWTLLSVTPTFGTTADGSLAGFAANVNGQFSVPYIPEPSAMSLVAVGATGLIARRRKA